MTITIPDELRAKAEERAKRFGFASLEDYVLDFLEDEENAANDRLPASMAGYSRDELETILLEGINSGNPVPVDDNYWKVLHEKIQTGTLRKPGRPS